MKRSFFYHGKEIVINENLQEHDNFLDEHNNHDHHHPI
jgi:hypothetical protein